MKFLGHSSINLPQELNTTLLNKMGKLKKSTSSSSKCLLISANFLLFGLFCYLFVNQSQIPYDQQLLVSGGLLSKFKPSSPESPANSPTSSTPSTESPTSQSPSSTPIENPTNNPSSQPSSTPGSSSNSPTSSNPSTGSPTGQSPSSTPTEKPPNDPSSEPSSTSESSSNNPTSSTPVTGSPSQTNVPSGTPTENPPNNPSLEPSSTQNSTPIPESSGNTPKDPTTSPLHHPFTIEDPQEYPFTGRTIPLSDETNKFVTVPPLSSAQRILCGVLKNRNCNSHFIAEVVDLVWVLAPIYIYSTYGDQYYYYLKLHENFKSYIKSFGINHITIEAIRFPNQTKNPISLEPTTYSETIPNNEPYDIQVYYYNVTYIRENLLNVAIRKLDKLLPWEYVVWIDAHQFFENPYWWEEAVHKIERFASVQLFEEFDWLTYENSSHPHVPGVIRMSLFANFLQQTGVLYGNAYILSKDLYNQIGYIYDECIATSCDCAYALASFPEGVTFPPFAPTYYKTFEPWISNTKKVFKSRRSYVRGLIKHFSHGRNFPYGDIQNLVDASGFDPARDLGRDSNFSIYIKNEYISKRMEDIILNFKNTDA